MQRPAGLSELSLLTNTSLIMTYYGFWMVINAAQQFSIKRTHFGLK